MAPEIPSITAWASQLTAVLELAKVHSTTFDDADDLRLYCLTRVVTWALACHPGASPTTIRNVLGGLLAMAQQLGPAATESVEHGVLRDRLCHRLWPAWAVLVRCLPSSRTLLCHCLRGAAVAPDVATVMSILEYLTTSAEITDLYLMDSVLKDIAQRYQAYPAVTTRLDTLLRVFDQLLRRDDATAKVGTACAGGLLQRLQRLVKRFSR
jgi:hypothetical protein